MQVDNKQALKSAKRWFAQKWLRWIVGVVVVYTVVGFVVVPWIAERQLRDMASNRLSLDLTIERLYFNPYTMLLEVEALRLSEGQESPLLELGMLRSNFSPLRLALLKLHFSEFEVANLDLYFTRATTSDNTAAMLADRWLASGDPETTPVTAESQTDDDSGDIIPLEVTTTRLNNLNVHFLDEVPDEPFATVFTLAEAEINGLSSIADRSASKSILLRFANDASLQFSGALQLNPLDLSGQIALDNFTLELVDRYVQQSLPFSLSNGRLGFATEYDLSFPEGVMRFTLDNISLELADLAVTQPSFTEPFLTTGLLQFENGRLAYPDGTVAMDAIAISQLDLQAIRNTNGEFNLLQMLAAIAGDESDPEVPADEASPDTDQAIEWVLQLDQFSVTDSQIGLLDNATMQPSNLATSLAFELGNINNRPGTTMPLSLRLAPVSGGELALEGDASILPDPVLQADTRLSDLNLTALQPYLNELASLNLDSATLFADLALTVNPEDILRVQGGLELREFSTSDQELEETILAWDRVAAEGIDLELGRNTLDISELILDQPFARVVINEDGSTNISRSIRSDAEEEMVEITSVQTPEEASQETTGASGSPPLNFILGRITVNEGRSDFTDRDLPIVFNANIRELTGRADGFSTQSSEPLNLDLEGIVDEFGQLQLSSTLNPLNVTAQSNVRLQFRNLDLPSVSPYTIKFAGREIADGNVDIDLQYGVSEGSLDANNRVVVRNLRLGDRVEQPGAMNLPLDLATALLKDSNGVIDLEIPVNGDVNDPEFDLGPAIRTAIGNAIGNIVAAPFRLLGSLVGGGDNDLDAIQFEPGRVAIAPPERQILEQLVAALAQRPELVLEIPLLQGEADREALKRQAVNERIEDLLQQTTEAEGSLTERRMLVVERLYNEVNLTPSLQELRQSNTLTPEPPEDGVVNLAEALVAADTLDVPAYVAQMRSRLIEAESVSEQDLANLAAQRVQSVSAYLAEQGLDTASRAQTGETQHSEPDDSGRLTMEFGLTAQR